MTIVPTKKSSVVSVKRPKTEQEQVWLALKGYRPGLENIIWYKELHTKKS